MPDFTTRPELRGRFGMVASTHWLASAAGMSVLERGGNAFDAAVAAGFALQVVEPHLNGPGGEVPIIFQAVGGEPTVLNGQGPAPAAAEIDAFSGMDRVPGSGILPACVPGAFDAWLLLLRDHGTFELRDVLEYAIGYATNGYPLLPQIRTKLTDVAPVFSRWWPTSAELYLTGGAPPPAGSSLRNEVLAGTFKRILAESGGAARTREGRIDAARHVWREGFVAEAISEFLSRPRPDGTGAHHDALLHADDLANWRARYEPTAHIDYAGLTVHKTGPWGQGPVFLQQLRLAEELGTGALDTGSAEFAHRVVEAAKLAFADREAWYGDPDFIDVPLEALLDPGYAAARAALVAEDASMDLRPGTAAGRAPYIVEPVAAGTHGPGVATTGEPTLDGAEQRGDTCHLDIVDAAGNMIAATPSGGWLAGSPVIGALGFPLGTRGQMFWLDARSPSAIAPGRRPRSTLSPTLVTRDDQPVMALGTPGGDQQDQWSFTYFLRLVHGGMDLQAGIDAPMFHTNAFPSSFHPRETAAGEIVVESRFGADAIEELRRRGHQVVVSDPWSLGRLSAVSRDPGTGILRAAANPRGAQGYAAGR